MEGTKPDPRTDVRAGLEKGREQARELAATAKERAKQQVESRRHGAADQVGRLAGAVEKARQELGDDSPVADYVGRFAGSMNGFAERLRTRSADELFDDFNRLARENPGLFLAGSVGLGFALSRFLKAASGPTAAPSGASSTDVASPPGGDPRPAHESPAAYEPPLGTTVQPLAADAPEFGGASGPGTGVR